jgi:GrpB-like predicted nucleotidyltransferase (UPF0157 family)
VHIREIDGPLWERLLVRDYLRAHAADRKSYADLKKRLAAEFSDDRNAYTNGKCILAAERMQRARTWHRTCQRLTQRGYKFCPFFPCRISFFM